MRKLSLNNFVLNDSSSIKSVMRFIDNAGIRVAYIVDRNYMLLGVVSDSEIRKAIISGIDIKEKVNSIINKKPIILNSKDLTNSYIVSFTIRKLLKKIPDAQHILVIDEGKKPLRLLSLTEISSNISHYKKSKKKSKKGKKFILIVGGAGFLGTVLVFQLLKRGYRVRILDSLLYGENHMKKILKMKNIEMIKGDMRNIEILVKALEDIDAVINLAAIVGDPACRDKPQLAVETNFLANKALADACKYHQINRFLYASTCSVYGQMEGNAPLDENAPLNPVSLYARSKIASEEAILNMEDENFAPTILRMCTLYGYSPRMRFDLVVNTMTKTAVSESKIYVHGGGTQWRPLLNVEDAARAYIDCLEAPLSKIKGQVFNVGSEMQNYQVIEIAKIVKSCIPKAEIIMSGDAQDPRNYSVSFLKIQKNINFHARNGLKDSINKIKIAIGSKEIINVNSKIYYNLT